ncbi:MAG: N-6 DNA methylase [Firmicutes bacterium]|nr:N-6 DNA methylase [Bacillota bacterium]
MSYSAIVRRYLTSLQQSYRDAVTGGQHTAELSYRTHLDAFIRELAAELSGNANIAVIHEPRNQARMGRPDWRIHDRNTLGIFGYIEAKGLSLTAFDLAPHEEQFNRYLSLGHKLIISDGIDFVYSFENGARPQVVSLVDKTQLNRANWSSLNVNPQFEVLMRRLFSEPAPQYCDEGQLVEQVALRTRLLSNEIKRCILISIDEAMDTEERQAISLLSELREMVCNHNDETLRNDAVFSDFAAQVIMFTLLYAHRVECTDADAPVEKARKTKAYIERDVEDGQALRPFLKIIRYINNHEQGGSFISMWTEECIQFLSFVHMTERQRQRPDYHKLFEQFFSKFDSRSRFDYGAYYTPADLADCIVRLTEAIVGSNFDGASIFDDENTIIDPCCGTGSFLEKIRQLDTRRGSYNLCGIEILPAPYMLASYRMAVLNHEIEGGRSRSELVLANSLSNCVLGEPADINTVQGFELNRAYEISSRPITLVIGNPPSSDSARMNTGEDFSRILELMDDFRPPTENRHGRQNTQKQINNPYLQFLRWSCEKLENSNNHSALAFIVPASFLEADSYKYARKYIAEKFSSLWVVSVDGDARSGIRSDSMFNTQQGRAIIIATRRYGETQGLSQYKYFDVSRHSKADKLAWFRQDTATSLAEFSVNDVGTANYALHPSLPFNEELYSSYWAVNTVFKHTCSGIKLAPSSLFTHLKAPMIKRRSREIMQNGQSAATEWLGGQDKPPKAVAVTAFALELNAYGNAQAVDALFDRNIVDYAFRPFFPMKAFLWRELLDKFKNVGGGGTRRRPEISKAYSMEGTVGLAVAHSPKDQKESLRQFVSFCWYYPDNDLCRRGDSYIYLNKHPINNRRNDDFNIVNNINDQLRGMLETLLGVDGDTVANEMVFYAFGVLCSQVYLDEFEGALFTVNRADMRPRIPVVNNPDIFRRIVELGKRLARLERRDYAPENLIGYNYDDIKAQVPADFRMHWSRALQPFNEEEETLTLSNGRINITVACPLEVQRINISGYEIIKNVWLKFNSYGFTHCSFTPDDMHGLLDLMNKLVEYNAIIGEIDDIMHEVIEGRYPLIVPNE